MSENTKVLADDAVERPSSGTLLDPAEIERAESRVRATLDVPAVDSAHASPAAKLLNEPRLPELKRRDRARLQMQSPTRLYFYWSLASDPLQRLKRAFGPDADSYLLVAKLINDSDGTEEIHPVEAEGNWWFRVRPDASYRAELGFYAPNRPYFRVLFSNSVSVPRSGPSSRTAADADWIITSEKFAEVLDLSGYTRDAESVAFAEPSAEFQPELLDVIGGLIREDETLDEFSSEDLYRGLLAIASGVPIEALRWVISARFFALLQANAEKAFSADLQQRLREIFGLDEIESVFAGDPSAVFGASRVNFPTGRRRRARPVPIGAVPPPGSHSFPLH